MSLQGCSEFNPVVLLSASEMKASGNTSQRNVDDAPNRRVVMFFFKKGTKVNPDVWPCPKVKEPLDACRAAFWPDGEARRTSGDEVRKYSDTRDTMACRFSDRFARRSPCERSARVRTIKVRLTDPDRIPVPYAVCRFVDQPDSIQVADDQGIVEIPLQSEAQQVSIQWELPKAQVGGMRFYWEQTLNVTPPTDDDGGLLRRFAHLAFNGESVDENVASWAYFFALAIKSAEPQSPKGVVAFHDGGERPAPDIVYT